MGGSHEAAGREVWEGMCLAQAVGREVLEGMCLAQAAGWEVWEGMRGLHAPHDDRRLAQVAQMAQMVFDLK